MRRAEAALIAAAAAWGLAAGIAVATLFFAPPHPGQLPGAMLVFGLDARAPMRMMLAVMLAPFLAALLARPVARHVAADPRTQPWAVCAMVAALLGGLWLVLVDPFNVIAVLFAPLVAAAGFLLMRRLSLPSWERRPRAILAFVVYPLIALAIGVASDRSYIDGRPLLNVFEDGHSLTPANEMRRGERPYRDIVPVHGLAADGLVDLAAISLGADDAGAVLRFRRPIAWLLPVAVYAMAFAAIGSAEAALLALLAAACLTIAGTPWVVPVSAVQSLPAVRALPSLVALALCAAALRLDRPRLLACAAALAVVACFTSIEFGIYAVVAVAIAVICRRRMLVAAAVGIAAAATIAFLALAVAGALPAFFRVTFREIPPLTEAYSMAIFRFPPAYAPMLGFPEILGGLFAARIVWIVAWGLIAVGTAAVLAMPNRPRAVEPLLPLGAWVVAAALSYGERTNVYFMPVAVVIAVAAAWALPRWPRVAAIVVLLVIAAPSQWLARQPEARRNVVAVDAPPRIRGVWVERDNAVKLAAARQFIDRLPPGDTWFDFTNMAILYYLFDRDCPIRQYEVPLYETAELQREVIARIDSNPHVRAALVQFPNLGATDIDNLPNALRAPLVAAYLRAHFVPAYSNQGIVFWVRR
jgi:hypothetical protein